MKNNNAYVEIEKITWPEGEKIPNKNIAEIVRGWLSGAEYQKLDLYGRYYEAINPILMKRWKDRNDRNKTPNNWVPTAYYSTIVDTMAGYMFQNIDYSCEDEIFDETLGEILDNNDTDIKDMTTGIRTLAFNKGVELVYTVGNETGIEIKYATIDPRQMIIVYNQEIEPKIIVGIRVVKSLDKDFDYDIDVIYKDEWQYFKMKSDEIKERIPSRALFFSECPVIEYKTEILNSNSSFHVVIPYIDALDYVVTGNANEIERLVDALLVLGKLVSDEDLKHMDEWKFLEGMKTGDRAEYISKNMDPMFREYVTKLLIQEIHKHSHVIDWYSPDSGLTGAVSAKALQTRLFDMNMFSNRIEKIYKKGAYKRVKLIAELMKIKGLISDISVIDKLKIKYNRTLPSSTEDTAQTLSNVPFLSNQTKVELCGLDWSVEEERLGKEKDDNLKRMEDSLMKQYSKNEKPEEESLTPDNSSKIENIKEEKIQDKQSK